MSKSPLSTLLGFAQLLQHDGRTPGRRGMDGRPEAPAVYCCCDIFVPKSSAAYAGGRRSLTTGVRARPTTRRDAEVAQLAARSHLIQYFRV